MNDIVERLRSVDFAVLRERLAEVLANPAANLTALFFILAAVALVGLIVVLFITMTGLALQQRRADREEREAAAAIKAKAEREAAEKAAAEKAAEQGADAESPGETATLQAPAQVVRRASRSDIYTWLFIGMLVLAAVFITVGYSGSRASCYTACHSNLGSTYVTDGAEIRGHVNAPCVSCHEGDDLDRLASVPARLEHVAVNATGRTQPLPPASSSACIQCHREIESGVLKPAETPVRMSHSEPLAAGLACKECHAVGHEKDIDMSGGARMAVCIRCHDNERASAECQTCHIGDPGELRRATNKGRTLGTVTSPAKIQCGGCHDLRPCDSCHGVRMPHSREFEQGGHAYTAAFEGKQKCMKCHTTLECSQCHLPFTTHGKDWKAQHGVGRSFSSPCACHAPADNRSRPWCPQCHTSRPPGALP